VCESVIRKRRVAAAQWMGESLMSEFYGRVQYMDEYRDRVDKARRRSAWTCRELRIVMILER
jgi:hypothetical protein